MNPQRHCPDCEAAPLPPVTRRQFVKAVGATAAAASVAGAFPAVARAASAEKKPETLVKKLYDSLSDSQKKEIWFPWDHTENRGLLRMVVRNNWHITKPTVTSEFFTSDQQDMIEAIFWDLYSPDWKDQIAQQIQDDAGGYGKAQNIAIFGEPGTGKFQFVMTGRHLTIRCDGDSAEHVAFGGPIFYGHAAQGFNEKPDHPGNVFWYQALKANELYKMLDGRQQKQALIAKQPGEHEVHFRRSASEFPGLPVSELSGDQKEHMQRVLEALVDPYRNADREEVSRCLKAQGGLDACHIAFYKEGDLGDDQVWDVWRLEGPSFVWHFRGEPHVHVWVNVADDPSVKVHTS